MLVLSRKPGQTIVIDGGRIIIKIKGTARGSVRIGIEADYSIKAVRGELLGKVANQPAIVCETTDGA